MQYSQMYTTDARSRFFSTNLNLFTWMIELRMRTVPVPLHKTNELGYDFEKKKKCH